MACKFKPLTDFLNDIPCDNYGEWTIDQDNDGFSENPRQMPYVVYSEIADKFINAFYLFKDEHLEYSLNNYRDILNANGMEWSTESMSQADVSKLDEQAVLALICGAIRADRFSEGALLNFFERGSIGRWLMRLSEIDNI
jgi:hypothetical protein